ncbi:WecB/TagA/CpsF family glycosyltransferase [Dyadobacter jiangsuensis]
MPRKTLFGTELNIDPYDKFLESILKLVDSKQKSYVCVVNVHMLIESYEDPKFREIVNNSALNALDGKPLTWAIRSIYGTAAERVCGMDLLPDLLNSAEAKGVGVYFYGGTPDMLQKLEHVLRERFPRLKVSGLFSPPFRKLTADEEYNVISQINASGAQLLFVALGCPKQEKWMASMTDKINLVMIGVGGAVPVLAGVQNRAPKWMQDAGLEWLARLLQEPKRLFKRYAITNSKFLYLLGKELLKNKAKSLSH